MELAQKVPVEQRPRDSTCWRDSFRGAQNGCSPFGFPLKQPQQQGTLKTRHAHVALGQWKTLRKLSLACELVHALSLTKTHALGPMEGPLKRTLRMDEIQFAPRNENWVSHCLLDFTAESNHSRVSPQWCEMDFADWRIGPAAAP